MRFAGLPISLLILTFASLSSHGQVKVQLVAPRQTDAAIATVNGPHVALYDPHVASAHRLFLFLVGTRSKATSSMAIDSAFAKWGYHAIGLDYENGVIAVSCAHSPDRACFDDYRKAIVTGAAVSSKISVDPANSILNRVQKLLVYLVKNDPGGGWDEFVADGQPVWSRIVVAGHSQGAGHAAFIGKLFAVDKVLMFSGPQDYMDDLDAPAPWQGQMSATPPSRFFAFLSVHDPFNVHHQIANCMKLMNLAKPETQRVEPGEPIPGDSHILTNDIVTRQPHGSTLFPEFVNVWKYMATAGGQ